MLSKENKVYSCGAASQITKLDFKSVVAAFLPPPDITAALLDSFV